MENTGFHIIKNILISISIFALSGCDSKNNLFVVSNYLKYNCSSKFSKEILIEDNTFCYLDFNNSLAASREFSMINEFNPNTFYINKNKLEEVNHNINKVFYESENKIIRIHLLYDKENKNLINNIIRQTYIKYVNFLNNISLKKYNKGLNNLKEEDINKIISENIIYIYTTENIEIKVPVGKPAT
jgi:hypothetical protein